MYKKYYFLFALFFVLTGCSINKRDKNKLKHGRWIIIQKTSDGEITTFGRYKHGEQIGKWITKINDSVSQKDKIKLIENNRKKKFQTYRIATKTYYPNGKIHESGESMQIVNNVEINARHWYKFGPWKRYDENGKIILIKYYNEGKLQSYFENDSMYYDLSKFVDKEN